LWTVIERVDANVQPAATARNRRSQSAGARSSPGAPHGPIRSTTSRRCANDDGGKNSRAATPGSSNIPVIW
jgi:hypothetical protein